MATLYAEGDAARPQSNSVTDPAKGPQLRVLITWALLSVTMIVINLNLITMMRFGDPDDALRLLQVRDLLAGQSWFDVHQYRIAAPEGVAMHWSRLVDVPIAGMILLLRPLLGTAMAETATVIIVPLLTLLCAMTLLGRLAARWFNDEVVALSGLMIGLSPAVLCQFTPMRIDHHGWQIVLALTALSGLHARNARQGGIVIGLSLAALLAISIEGLPLTALFLGICALRGLRAPQSRFDWFAASAGTLALGSAAIFLGTRGTYDLVTHCDAISPVHLALLGWVATGAAVLHFAAPRTLVGQLGALGVMGLGAAAIMFGVAPECRGGAFVMLDPLVKRYWYDSVAEGMPFWHTAAPMAAAIAAGPLVGLYGVYRLWREAGDARTRLLWLDHMLLLAGAWLIGLAVARASATALVFAAVPAAALIMRGVYHLRSVPILPRLGGYAIVISLLAPGLPVVVAMSAAAPLMAKASSGHLEKSVGGVTLGSLGISKCRYDVAGRALNQLPAVDIFAPLDIGPDLIVKSHDRVIATGHHRGAAGMHDVIAAFMASPDEAHALIRKRHASLVAVCPDIYEPSVYAARAPQGLMADLLRDRPPVWLQPVDIAPGSHIKFWRVVN
ncbi:hypothetical protein NSE01_12630 [Novosphingobium sediminis]|uniref:Glycosyltransferase RgtA/B/C/D-like domain-containing protein n=1 Tax=Novosphingobium sediminis TaxID=707214 RepID=A0A512AI93_9SPHN|nr:hypothetical protein [Novosphingobium sediminis]GEN99430.1 hypothetical protein NSE01_12630 [Novosphingobium sediminis]